MKETEGEDKGGADGDDDEGEGSKKRRG